MPSSSASGWVLERRYTFPYIPIGLFSRLLVRILYRMEGRLVKVFSCCRDSLSMQSEENQHAWVRYEAMNGELTIHAWSPALLLREKLFTETVECVEYVLASSFQSLSDKVQRTVLCSLCGQHEHSVEQLSELLSQGQTKVGCQKTARSVSIVHLAPDLSLNNLPLVAPGDLQLGQEIGRGGTQPPPSQPDNRQARSLLTLARSFGYYL
jgi:hypothetical protein